MGTDTLFVSGRLKRAGVVLAVLTGLLHLIEAPEYYGDVKYIGLLFVANAIGGLAAAYGIWHGSRAGWLLGFVVAGGALMAYVLSRTIGLPNFREARWPRCSSRWASLSALVEAAFLVAFYKAWPAIRALPRGTSLPDLAFPHPPLLPPAVSAGAISLTAAAGCPTLLPADRC